MRLRSGTAGRRTSGRPCLVRSAPVSDLAYGFRNGFTDVCICTYSFCSAGCRTLQELEVGHVEVDDCGDAKSAAEGAVLGLFSYDELKSKKKTRVTSQLHGR